MHEADRQTPREWGAIVAAFDRWGDLRCAAESVSAEISCFKAVLHGGKAAPDPAVLAAVDEIAKLECPRLRRNTRRKREPAAAGAAAVSIGGNAFAATLCTWMNGAQKVHLQEHIDKGRVLL